MAFSIAVVGVDSWRDDSRHPHRETKRNGDNLVQHNRAGVGPVQDFFRCTAEPDGQENRGDSGQFAAPDFRPPAGGFFIGSRALFSCACLMIWAKTVSPPVP